jgi:hypothetical protein
MPTLNGILVIQAQEIKTVQQNKRLSIITAKPMADLQYALLPVFSINVKTVYVNQLSTTIKSLLPFTTFLLLKHLMALMTIMR